MATAVDDPDALTLARMDPDAAKFYEVVDGQIVENPPMGGGNRFWLLSSRNCSPRSLDLPSSAEW